uniref:Macrophage migration inhibitory factor n=1 Tax=Anas zonorhyncha TaxID=75864 RepID=A0A8B9ZTR6_9AVES
MKYIQEKFKSLSNGIWDFAIFKTFPNMYLAIQISPDQVMSFGGSTAPCAMCFLYSIGKIGEQENKVYSKLLCDLLNKQLKIPSDRIYVSFFEISAANVGWNNTTFA